MQKRVSRGRTGKSLLLTLASMALSPAEKEMILSGCMLRQDLVDGVFRCTELVRKSSDTGGALPPCFSDLFNLSR